MRPALGTFVEVRVSGRASEKSLLRKIDLAFSRISQVDSLMSFHAETSDLTRLNQATVGRWIDIHPLTARVLRRALALQRDSDGIFDVAIANVLSGRRGKAAESSSPAFEVLGKRARRLRTDRIDLGGIAKGFAVDRAIDGMKRAFSGSGLVNAGGDLRIFGAKTAAILIRQGAPSARARLKGSIRLRSMALASSHSNPDKVLARRRKLFRGSRTVSIVAPECMIADALTKVVLMGEPAVASRCLRKYRARLVSPPAVSPETGAPSSD